MGRAISLRTESDIYSEHLIPLKLQ